jgi:hypothetical protein
MKKLETTEKKIKESEITQKVLNTPLQKAYDSIISMIHNKNWDQGFVKKLFLGFMQVLKALDCDYETIDDLTLEYLPFLNFREGEIDSM